jgi:hypothetical protein
MSMLQIVIHSKKYATKAFGLLKDITFCHSGLTRIFLRLQMDSDKRE